ncbi:NAD(P)H dehydrogenase%2C quinone 1 [Bordetella ansorpii]|uniref:NAD(P)H dehydrogenase, quinone 1 n=1 Tax=Bordetella ansorpii TaxID=288768 RepID=A0A157SNH6_9BORD|nr:NAD(P)H-dependent oxidoreductase [Bordetella ansorpii]SAI71962.1 NAD(P)H dehydrogenase%2C quinone 1 [Bordetella ansorpii]
MHALIVASHPDRQSLTHAVAQQVEQGIATSGPHTAEIADLAAEGFNPSFNAADFAQFQGKGPAPSDVRAEQARLQRAQALVLVYPVYWWSFPGLLKGWIDRVFTNGWAYEDNNDGKLVKKLEHLQVHLVAIGGADMRTYDRHGYQGAMKLQIDHGIFGYCGAPVVASELLLPVDGQIPSGHLDTAHAIGQRVFEARAPS